MGDKVDLTNFKKHITCGGRAYDDFSNFAPCTIRADDKHWPTTEHYYQALKFPGPAGAQMRDAIRTTSSPMESFTLGNSRRDLLRPDWELVKLDMMYQANFLKFSQAEHLKDLLAYSEGPIVCDGGLFWKTWNEIILERIREELRSEDAQDLAALELRKALMETYSSAVAKGNQREIDAVVMSASRRELPQGTGGCGPVTVSGLRSGADIVFNVDPLAPQVNGQPHWVSEDDSLHLYLGMKRGRYAWVIDEMCAPNEASGEAYKDVAVDFDGVGSELSGGAQEWQVFAGSRHEKKELVVHGVGGGADAEAAPVSEPAEVARDILQIFQAYDKNGDKKISEDELGIVLKKLDNSWTRRKVAMLLREMDTNHDSKIDYEEFVAWIVHTGTSHEKRQAVMQAGEQAANTRGVS